MPVFARAFDSTLSSTRSRSWHVFAFSTLILLSAGLAPLAWAQTSTASGASPSAASITPNEWQACLKKLESQSRDAGIQAQVWKAEMSDLAPNVSLVERLSTQPEFVMPVWDYMASLVDDERVVDGLRAMQSHTAALNEAQKRFGVDPATTTAVWGIESGYGRSLGSFAIVRSLATLSCMGRRQPFFTQELFAALRIVQSGDFPSSSFKGSWAGAFGQTQFMPSTFERLAVDLDGDGKRNLITSNADALGSTARFLQDAGWLADLTWGAEVKLPAGFDANGEGRKNKRTVSEWKKRGVTLVNNKPIAWDNDVKAGLLMPAGVNGPVFLVTQNFDAIYRYNASENYGLAIAHLSDRLRGAGKFATPWPTDDAGLSRAERRELQTLLASRGHDVGAIDGYIGERTRNAVKAEQLRLGHEATGRAGQKILNALRNGS
ncbi:MAG: hypothetical protein RLZZ397_370 [Pseudomonadota bacterium]